MMSRAAGDPERRRLRACAADVGGAALLVASRGLPGAARAPFIVTGAFAPVRPDRLVSRATMPPVSRRLMVPAIVRTRRTQRVARSAAILSSSPDPDSMSDRGGSAIERRPVKRDPPLQALAEARHADPFGVLGPHVEPEGVVIRAVIPTAERITVTRNGSGSGEMTRRHPAGIFEAVLPDLTEIPDYRLQVCVSGRRDVRNRRSVPLRPRPVGLRLVPVRRRANIPASTTSWARTP